MEKDRIICHGALRKIKEDGSAAQERYYQLCLVTQDKFKYMNSKCRQLTKEFFHPLNIPHYVKGIFFWKTQTDAKDWAKLKGLIVLEDYTTGCVNGRENVFILCQNKQTHQFVARSKKERDEWVTILQEGITSNYQSPNHYKTVRYRSASPRYNHTYQSSPSVGRQTPIDARSSINTFPPDYTSMMNKTFPLSTYSRIANNNFTPSYTDTVKSFPPAYTRSPNSTSLSAYASSTSHGRLPIYQRPKLGYASPSTLTIPDNPMFSVRSRSSYELPPFHLRGYDTIRSASSDGNISYKIPSPFAPTTPETPRIPSTYSNTYSTKLSSTTSEFTKKIRDHKLMASSQSLSAGNIYETIPYKEKPRSNKEESRSNKEEHIYLTPLEVLDISYGK